MRVFGHMTRSLLTIKPSTSIQEAYNIMLTENVRHLVVTNRGKLVGLVSDRDIFKVGEMEFEVLGYPAGHVKEIMSIDLLTCTPSTSIGDAARMLVDNKINCLPVTQFGKLIGLITSTDIMEILSSKSFDSIHAPIPVTTYLPA